eukprot:4424617-Prymnesium_polylepis.1
MSLSRAASEEEGRRARGDLLRLGGCGRRDRDDRVPHALDRVHAGVDGEAHQGGGEADPQHRDPAEPIRRAPDERGAHERQPRTQRRLAALAQRVAAELVAPRLDEGKGDRGGRDRQEGHDGAEHHATVRRGRDGGPCCSRGLASAHLEVQHSRAEGTGRDGNGCRHVGRRRRRRRRRWRRFRPGPAERGDRELVEVRRHCGAGAHVVCVKLRWS